MEGLVAVENVSDWEVLVQSKRGGQHSQFGTEWTILRTRCSGGYHLVMKVGNLLCEQFKEIPKKRNEKERKIEREEKKLKQFIRECQKGKKKKKRFVLCSFRR